MLRTGIERHSSKRNTFLEVHNITKYRYNSVMHTKQLHNLCLPFSMATEIGTLIIILGRCDRTKTRKKTSLQTLNVEESDRQTDRQRGWADERESNTSPRHCFIRGLITHAQPPKLSLARVHPKVALTIGPSGNKVNMSFPFHSRDVFMYFTRRELWHGSVVCWSV